MSIVTCISTGINTFMCQTLQRDVRKVKSVYRADVTHMQNLKSQIIRYS